MAEPTRESKLRGQWRFPIAMGVSIGVATPVSRGITAALEPHVGYWAALLLSVVAAGVVAGALALVLFWMLRPRGTKGS